MRYSLEYPMEYIHVHLLYAEPGNDANTAPGAAPSAAGAAARAGETVS
jgi:hypothetical protein